MNRRIAIPAIIFIIGVACLCDASAGPITYYVEPVSFDNGYTVEGGHITVADLTDALEPEDVMDYEVIVNGPTPFTFSPDNPNSHVVVEGRVTADLQSLVVREGQRVPPWGSYSSLRLEGLDAGDGRYEMRWSVVYVTGVHSWWSEVHYRNPGLDDQDMNVIPSPPWLITVGTVPEPSTIMLLLLGTSAVGFFARRNRNSANLSRPLSIVVVAFTLVSTGHARTIFYDDFEDGDHLDGMPVSWDITGTDPDDEEMVVDGSLVITSGGINGGFNYALASDFVLTNTSVRVQGTAGTGDVFGVGVRYDTEIVGYWAIVDAGGEIATGGYGERFATGYSDLRPEEEDIVLQLDCIDNQLSVWAWRPGESMPDAPLVTATDDRSIAGFVGLGSWNWPWSNEPVEVIYRYVHVADSHIPEPSTLAVAVLAFLVVVCRVRRTRQT